MYIFAILSLSVKPEKMVQLLPRSSTDKKKNLKKTNDRRTNSETDGRTDEWTDKMTLINPPNIGFFGEGVQ